MQCTLVQLDPTVSSFPIFHSSCVVQVYYSLSSCLVLLSYTQNSPTLVVSHFTMANIFAAQVWQPATIVLGTNLMLAFTSFGSSSFILCSGLLVGSVWILRVYSPVPARVPTFSWPTKNREVPHAPEKREARTREEEEETGMTFHLLTFTVPILLTCLFV